MTDSAISARRRRRDATTRALVGAARRRTAAVGLAGFTVEELCADAGVSRRTFFNHFAAKEDAVLGIPLHLDDADAEAAFLAAPTPLVDAYADLVAARWALLGLDRTAADELMAAVEREPRLITAMIERGRDGDARDVELIASCTDGDRDRAFVCVQLVGQLARTCTAEVLDPATETTFSELLHRRLDATRALLVADTTASAREGNE